EVRVGKLAAAGFGLAPDFAQFAPDLARLRAVAGVEPLEDFADPAVAARHQGLEVGFTRRFGLQLDGSVEPEKRRADHRDLALEAARILHRVPLERSPRLGHERIE